MQRNWRNNSTIANPKNTVILSVAKNDKVNFHEVKREGALGYKINVFSNTCQLAGLVVLISFMVSNTCQLAGLVMLISFMVSSTCQFTGFSADYQLYG